MSIRFGIDIDGTVTSADALLPFINKDFNLKLSAEDITEYDLTPFVNVSEHEFFEWFTRKEPTIYLQSTIAKHAQSILNKWEREHELIFITARGKNMRDITIEWLQRHNIHFDHIELLGSHHKVNAAKKLNVDLFFEDKHDNAVSIHEECKIPVILFDTPYNRKPSPQGVIRVHSWLEADQWVSEWINQEKLKNK